MVTTTNRGGIQVSTTHPNQNQSSTGRQGRSESRLSGTNQVTGHPAVDEAPVRSTPARRALAVLRIGFGLTFLWAFFDKLLGLGFATGAITDPETGARTGIDFMAKDQAWLNGGSPTEGFLSFGVPAHNPFHDTFASMAGQAWADWLFMAGLVGIGLTMTFGIGIRLGAIAGTVLYLLMWVASWPLANNPVIDDHLLGLLSMVVLGLALAGDTWGAGRAWARTDLVRRFPVLR
jgi:thiosulfate dehydrogenase (quinone) large subunit